MGLDSMSNKKIVLRLFVLILMLLIYPAFVASEIEKHLPKFPKVELSFKKPFWAPLFNSMWPRPEFAFIIKNVSIKDDKIVDEGVLILEIAEDKGLGQEPSKDDFTFFTYRMFDGVSIGKQIKLVFNFSEKYKPGRFRIKPTLFIFPKDSSPIKTAYKKMEQHGAEVLGAWESVYFQDWYNNLTQVLGTKIIEHGSYIVTFEDKAFFS